MARLIGDPNGSFLDNFVAMADDFGSWLTTPLNPDRFASFADDAGGVAVTTPSAPAEISAGVGHAVGDAITGTEKAATDGLMTVLAWGGVLVVGALALRHLER